MFEDCSEKEAKQKILDEVYEYCQKFMLKKTEFKPGDRINYAGRVYDSKEVVSLVDSALEFWLTAGRFTKEFEEKLGEYLGIKYVSLVNSGSSANLLAFMSLTSPLLGDRRIEPGDEVITAACGFPTTISPIIQYGAIPVFVDVRMQDMNLDETLLENALSKKTKAVMIAHTLGNPFNISAVKEFCDKYGLWLIEDNCDALGSEYTMPKGEYAGIKKKTGTFGDVGTSSFYPPHHITMGEGGAVYTNDPLLNKIIRSMRDWGRDCMCPPGTDGVCKNRFTKKYKELEYGYDHKYVYSHFGYNLKATDLQASIGCEQLKKIDSFTVKRRKNFGLLDNSLRKKGAEQKFILPKACENSEPSWFGYLITCKDGVKREEIIKKLEERNIQTRMLFAGNIIKHPCFDGIRDNKEKYRISDNLYITDIAMKSSFWVGVYPGMTEDMIEYMAEIIMQ